MIKIVPAKEIYLKGNNQAVLLLHAFTSHTRDMKKVAIEIHKKVLHAMHHFTEDMGVLQNSYYNIM